MQNSRPNTVGRLIAITILMVGLTFAVCYLRLFVFPNVPILLLGDAIGLENEGARIVARQLLYRDFFEILPPGTPYTYALLVRTFGLRNWIPLAVMPCLAGITVLLMTLASGRIMRGNVIALPALLFAGPILFRSADATHHWFSTILVLTAMLILLGKNTILRIAAARSMLRRGRMFHTDQRGNGGCRLCDLPYMEVMARELKSARCLAQLFAALWGGSSCICRSELVFHRDGRTEPLVLLPRCISTALLSGSCSEQLAGGEIRVSRPTKYSRLDRFSFCVLYCSAGLHCFPVGHAPTMVERSKLPLGPIAADCHDRDSDVPGDCTITFDQTAFNRQPSGHDSSCMVP